MTDWLRAAFALIYHAVPGQYQRLRRHLELAPPDVQQEFLRLLQAYDVAVSRERLKARQPWRR